MNVGIRRVSDVTGVQGHLSPWREVSVVDGPAHGNYSSWEAALHRL